MHDQNNGQHQRIINKWETLEIIVDETKPAGKFDFSLEIVTEKPIFEDGESGYERVLATIQVGDRFLRLNGKALSALMSVIENNEVNILKAINNTNTANEDIRRQNYQRKQHDLRHKQPSDNYNRFNQKPKRHRDKSFDNEE
jgi:hypothetical protein